MGERFGHYEIMRRLAAGGMAEVLLAKQTSLGGFERLVCLKRILPHLSGQEEFLRMFQDEARIAANLVHPNVAQIYDIDQEDGQYYIAMEYVRGEDLRRVYNQEVGAGHAIPKHVAALIIMGAAAGLDYAHRQTTLDGAPLGIVHRDVSPQNILVTYDGHVKLIDFGVAKAAGKLNQTRAGVLKGKYSYMSPEQASGDPLDGRTDIFALGITLYEITTGTRLFKRDNELETLHAVIACNVKPPRDIVPNFDADLENIVLRALAYDVDSRYATAGELEHDLERYLLRRGHPTSASSLAGYMQDLFAQKLADEALFSGPPWSETATPSRRGAKQAGNSTSNGKAATSSQGSPQPATQGLGEPESTVVDPPLYTVTPHEFTTMAVPHAALSGSDDAGTPAEWRPAPQTNEQTAATQSDGEADGPQGPTALATQPMDPVDPLAATPAYTPEPVPHRQAVGVPKTPAPWVPRLMAAAMVICVGAWAQHHLRKPKPAATTQTTQDAPAVVPDPAPKAPSPKMAVAAQSFRDGGTMDVRSPVAMAVSLGGQYLGDTPLHAIPLPAGVLLLKLENRRDGGTINRTIRVERGQHIQLVVGEERGTLDVEGVPWAWVQMGTHPAHETPAHLELLEGDYLVTTECPDGRRKQQTVQVSRRAPTRITVRCSP